MSSLAARDLISCIVRLNKNTQNGLDVEVADLLDASGASVKDFDGDDSNSLLNYAAANGHDSVVELLLARGADVDSGSMYHWTPLMQVCVRARVQARVRAG